MDQSLREIVELVRVLRHDLNGPLTSALGNVQLLLEDPTALAPDVRETLSEVEADLRRLAVMIRRLSDVTAPGDE
jgi:signal transduction histidine kinase